MEGALPGIIVAKTRVPPLRAGLVPREEILDSLCDTTASVVLVQAPAGFGKSTVLEQWAHQGQRRFAWVSLDPSESDSTLFWRYVYAAIQACFPGFASHLYDELSKPEPDLIGSIVPGLLNELAALEEPLVVVLDDYHRVHSREVDRSVQLLIRHLPRGTTLAIGTRSRPGFEVARLRSRGLVQDLRASDLSLTLDDASTLLRNQNPHRTDEEVRWIHERTEGWPAGIYLFGLVNSLDPSLGTTSDIRDYLMTEMLSSLSPEDLRFMRRTSILSHLEAGFCDYVTQGTSGQERLERLADSSLLIMPLDHVGDRFRYHHLLQAELELRLEKEESPDDLASLHRRAMEWTAGEGEVSEAIHHAVLAGEVDRAASLVAENWYPYLMTGRGRSAFLWLGEFSKHHLRSKPTLTIAAAMISAYTGHSQEAREFAAAAEAVTHKGQGLAGAESYESSVAAMRAMIAADGPISALNDARRAAEIEPLESPWRPTLVAMIGTFMYSTSRNCDPYALLLEGAEARTGPPELAVYALANLALFHAWRNDVESSMNYAQMAIEKINETQVGGLMLYGLPYAIVARFAAERGDVTESRRMLRHAERAERTASNAAPFDSMVLRTTMAEACIASGEYSLAKTFAERALGNLTVMEEGGLVANRLDSVIRQINKTALESGGETEPTGSLLSPREMQILSLFTTDESLADIGRRLFISRNTVKTHTSRIYRKLGVSNRQQAVATARNLSLL